MDKYCQTCNKRLELVKGVPPWNEDYMMCPTCNGTYNIFELEKCSCKYAHQNGICRWPTLEGRLNQPLTSRREALEQMQRNGDVLSEWVLKYLEKCIEEDKDLDKVRKKIKSAVDASPKNISFEDAKKQVDKFK